MSPMVSKADKMFYRKSTQGQSGTVNLDAETARVFAALDGNIQLSKVAQLADVSTAALWKAVAKLTRLGLIEPVDGGGGGFMGKPFIDAVQAQFARAVGPIGNILFQKVAGQMDISLTSLPADRARELIDKLSSHIPDENGRMVFRQTLLKDI